MEMGTPISHKPRTRASGSKKSEEFMLTTPVHQRFSSTSRSSRVVNLASTQCTPSSTQQSNGGFETPLRGMETSSRIHSQSGARSVVASPSTARSVQASPSTQNNSKESTPKSQKWRGKSGSSSEKSKSPVGGRIVKVFKSLPFACNFDLKNRIGEGTFSTVYLAHRKDKDIKIALKHLVPTSKPSRIVMETGCMRAADGHKNVIQLLGMWRVEGDIVLAMPYVNHSRFPDLIFTMDLREIQEYIGNLLSALRHIHRLGIIHRDIKPSNFLYDRTARRYALVDFGLAQYQSELNPGAKEDTRGSKRKANDENVSTSNKRQRDENTSRGVLENAENKLNRSPKSRILREIKMVRRSPRKMMSPGKEDRCLFSPKKEEGKEGRRSVTPRKGGGGGDTATAARKEGRMVTPRKGGREITTPTKRTRSLFSPTKQQANQPMKAEIVSPKEEAITPRKPERRPSLASPQKGDGWSVTPRERRLFSPNKKDDVKKMSPAESPRKTPRKRLTTPKKEPGVNKAELIPVRQSPRKHSLSRSNARYSKLTIIANSIQGHNTPSPSLSRTPSFTMLEPSTSFTPSQLSQATDTLPCRTPLLHASITSAHSSIAVPAALPKPSRTADARNSSTGSTSSAQCACNGKPRVCSICLALPQMHAPRAGTPGFRPPEVLLKHPNQTVALDIWAVGVIHLSILSRSYPFFRAPDDMSALAELIVLFGSKQVRELAKKYGRNLIASTGTEGYDLGLVCRELSTREQREEDGGGPQHQDGGDGSPGKSPEYKRLPHHVTEDGLDLLKGLLTLDHTNRITADEALKHPYFQDANINL